MRVPHVEIGKTTINGRTCDLDEILEDGTGIEVFPAPIECFLPLKFLLDVHLGKLAGKLRLLGFDSLYEAPWEDEVLAIKAAEQDRILLTRDRGLLMRKVLRKGLFIRSSDVSEQIKEIIIRMDLRDKIQLFSRCSLCNGTIRKMTPSIVDEKKEGIPPKAREYYDNFSYCESCGKIYWQGTHQSKIVDFAKSVSGG